MSQEISIILTRANWCPHCKHFEPIFKLAKEIYESGKDKFFKDYKIKFEDYDLADNNVKNTFTLNHYDIKDKIKGYPTLFVNLKNKTSKSKDYIQVDHTVINDELSKNTQDKDAAKRFIKNIANTLKGIDSDNKISYIQQGGKLDDNKCSLNFNNNEIDNIVGGENDKYKSKYLKYKSKYLKLKNKM